MPVLTQTPGSFTPQTSFNFYLGARPSGYGQGTNFNGLMDEPSVYNRALSDSEIQAIYNDGIGGNVKGGNGKFDPNEFLTSPSLSLAEAQVSVDGGAPAMFLGDNNNWQTKTIVFTATGSSTTLQIDGIEPGMLLDSFTLAQPAGDLYYLPEQSLDLYDGLNAQGAWTLEIQDDRVGATNPAPMLLNWQLRFNYTTTGTNANAIPPGTTQTNVIPAGGFAYYPVNVPANADAASNILVFATGPLNVWFNQTNNPAGINPPDFLLLGGSTSGTNVLTPGGTPPLLPGQTYFIGLQNTNSFAVTNGFQVDFHLIPPPPSLTNGVPVTNSVPPNSIAYYSVTVPTNADYATNLLLFAAGPLNVWFNQNGPPVGANPPDYLLITNATSGTNVLGTNTVPPLIPGLTYFLGVQNTNTTNVSFGLEVDFHFLSPPSVISGLTLTATNNGVTNGFLLTWSGPTNYQYAIQWTTNLMPPATWNTVLNPVINVTFTPTNGHYSWFDDGSLSGGWPPAKFYRVVASLISGPITNSAPVTNVIVPGAITPLTVTVPTNATAASNLLISASGPLNVWFNQTNAPTGTNAGDVLMLSNVTSGAFVLTNGSVPALVPGASYHLGLQNPGASNVTFVFQVNFALASPPSTNPASISSVTLTNLGGGTNAVLLKWIAPTNYQFQVQWTTSLAPPVAWNTISNLVLTWSGIVSATNLADGLFQFLDDGSLTGGFGPQKFYRLIQYPYSTPIPQPLSIINAGLTAGSVRFQWVAPTNYQYQIQWTTNAALPLSNWTILANPALGLSNGVFTFTDTNQTGPATSAKYFRLIEQ
jgi:hypothetical protein